MAVPQERGDFRAVQRAQQAADVATRARQRLEPGFKRIQCNSHVTEKSFKSRVALQC